MNEDMYHKKVVQLLTSIDKNLKCVSKILMALQTADDEDEADDSKDYVTDVMTRFLGMDETDE